jgi:catechol 2,3-dioxygenase-like lactoylglutathione lyase family enzyme
VNQLGFSAIDHVQLAMPPGGEERARAFYGGVLGMQEVEKPPELAQRGGCWFRSGSVEIHLGVEADFRPARKAHPGLRPADYEGLKTRLRAAGLALTEDDTIPGARRCHLFDPFGNRIELIHREPRASTVRGTSIK